MYFVISILLVMTYGTWHSEHAIVIKEYGYVLFGKIFSNITKYHHHHHNEHHHCDHPPPHHFQNTVEELGNYYKLGEGFSLTTLLASHNRFIIMMILMVIVVNNLRLSLLQHDRISCQIGYNHNHKW